MEKQILDVTCGSRSIWFQKNEPHTVYCDIRSGEFDIDVKNITWGNGRIHHKHMEVKPDIICSFTDLPFDNDSFNLVVFDPPHIVDLPKSSWTFKAYGTLTNGWQDMIRKGYEECMRVLKPNGVLVFKWSDVSISTRDVINAIGAEPLFGHRSGKKMNTHWMCYMKFAEEKE